MRAEYEVLRILDAKIVIRDTGSAKGKMSVTNDAEAVVKDLRKHGLLKPNMALHYYDSEDELAGIAWEGREDSVGFYAVLSR